MRVGAGDYVYELVERWGKLPTGWAYVDVVAVAVDSTDRVYVFNRGGHPVIIFARDGQYMGSWGEGVFRRPHGLHIGPDDAVYCVDDLGHAVRKFTADGKPLLSIEAGQPADTGYVLGQAKSVVRSGPPFNRPTGLTLARDGEIYVTDGYGNARVHRFAPDGRLLSSWGDPGDGPGQFMIPHGICIDSEGLVYVGDRDNWRIQVFGQGGEFITQWRDVRRPNHMCLDEQENMYVTELGHVLQGSPAEKRIVADAPRARVSVRDRSGRILAQWGASCPEAEGVFFAPHGIAVDSRGDIYVGEVSASYSGGLAPADRAVLHKYVRI